MRPVTRLRVPSAAACSPSIGASATASRPLSLPHRLRAQATPSVCARSLHATAPASSPLASTAPRRADVVPVYGQGPPPHAPVASEGVKEDKATIKAREDKERELVERIIRIERRKARAAAINKAEGGRFWKTTSVKEIDQDGMQVLQVFLDTRPLRHLSTKEIIQIPRSKRLLAHALAAEWDQLTSVRQATQGHRVPLTSLVCRALDLHAEVEKQQKSIADRKKGRRTQGDTVIENLLRYLDTDSLLCWMPAKEVDVFAGNSAAKLLASTRADVDGKPEVTLRQMQEKTAGPILAYMKEHVWPGVVVEPVLGGEGQDNCLFPKPHPAETRAAVAAWLEALNGWDLAGIERATLSGKSLVVAARLVTGVSPTAMPASDKPKEATLERAPLSVEDAFLATSMETAFQTAQWGEVEDTHDVEGADMRRHFGSVLLLVG